MRSCELLYLCCAPRVLGLLDDSLQVVDVGVDLPQHLDVRHLFLVQSLQLTARKQGQLFVRVIKASMHLAGRSPIKANLSFCGPTSHTPADSAPRPRTGPRRTAAPPGSSPGLSFYCECPSELPALQRPVSRPARSFSLFIAVSSAVFTGPLCLGAGNQSV